MREIKYRVWDEANKVMIPWEDFKKIPYVKNNFLGDGISDPTQRFMQFTGLFDKEGKEIYEGDVINAWWKTTPSTRFTETVPEMAPDKFHWFSEMEDLDCIIIGNIYQNKELLCEK